VNGIEGAGSGATTQSAWPSLETQREVQQERIYPGSGSVWGSGVIL